jgi:hypothetical protein
VAYDATNSKFQLVGASATSASGDNIFIFNASPSATLENSTAENTAGGRESTIQWKGLQSGSEESTLVKIIGSHDGTADDQKGKLQIYTNDGADGDSPTLQVTIDSAGLCALVASATIGGTLTVTGVTTHGGNVVSDTDSTDDLGTTGVRWANLFVDGITATDQITATGFTGTLDGILGSGAAAAATITTLDTSGVVNLNLVTDSSSSTSGALIIDGGVGIAKKLFVGTDADIDGTLEADAITLNGTALGSLYSPIAGSSSIVTTGALNSGSITSGFGAIDNGASAITTTGVITGGTVEATTDTAAGDNAAIGYTAAEGLILTGQGSTSDVTIKNDADATVMSIPTGTTNVGIGVTAVATNFKQEIVGNAGANNTPATSGTTQATSAVMRIRAGGGFTGTLDIGQGGGTGSWLQSTDTSNLATTYPLLLNPVGSNVGIGTTAPAALLHVGTTTAKIRIGATAGSAYLDISRNSATGNMIYNAAQASYGSHNFQIAGTERMRITPAGQVLISAASLINSDAAPLQVTGGSVTAVAVKGGTNNWFMAFYNTSNNVIGSIQGSTGTATSFNTASDYRLKENVDYSWDATTRLKQLKPARFNFIADAGKTVDGFLAHEVSSVVPEAIAGKKDGMKPEVLYVEGDELPDGKSVGDVKEASAPDYQGIDQSKLVPLLVKTIQELEARITALEAS